MQIMSTIHSFTIASKPSTDCRPWFLFRMSIILVLLWNMEFVMMLRVFALYERKPILGFCLALWFLVSRALNIWNGVDAMNDIKPDPLCNIRETPESSMWFSLTIIVNQLLLWLLTMDKYRNAQKAQWSMPPLLRIVMRDSSWVFVVLTALLSLMLPYAFYIERLDHLTFWMILNMRSMKVTEGSPGSNPELTTAFDTIGSDS
ncbi:hypothetical protein NP233_g12053 [Leucocoprinus birnbaumii]|uniref:Uncharacterized protein n=1 Tax=Leucocoprinus birnbaumii TaxID=56174 RepID=A0AAD5VFC8_9AGAR|nr:hypothetical protein NP233_g12053 [Leucocoprinus birnbaumii]